MIKAVQSSESVQAVQKKNNFKGTNNGTPVASASRLSQTQAAEYKYNLACLLAAQTQLENTKLKQQLASAAAEKNYYKACG